MKTVSGSSGFIGTHLVNRLISEGEKVLGIDKELPPVYSKFHDFRQIDLKCIAPNWYDFLEYNYNTIYHLAADAQQSVKYPERWINESEALFYNNVHSTYNLLLLFQRPEHLVFTSSAAVYGEGEDKSENSPIRCMNPYGYSKYICESVIEGANLPSYVMFRPGTVIGPYGRTFPNYLVWASVHGEKVKVFNNGLNTRSFIDVRDICEAFLNSRELPCGVYNIGDIPASYREVVDLVECVAEEYELVLDYRYMDYCPDGLVKNITLDTGKLDRYCIYEQRSLVESIRDMFECYLFEEDAKEPPRWK